jgi:6-phosphogluconolactonase
MAMQFLTLLGAFALTPLVCAQILYVGTYTQPQSSAKGIYAFKFDAKTGKLAELGLMADTPNPTFLAVHPNGKYLYAINEINEYQGKRAGSVTAYALDRTSGKLTLLNQVSSGGPGPCHLIVDATGKTLLVANYNGGSFASFPILPDGKLGEAASFIQDEGSSANPSRQSGPHAHSVNLPKSNKFMLGADLGTDKVMIFKLDASEGKIAPASPPSASVKPGSGPRHLVIAPDQKHVYVVNEMASTVTTFDYDPNTAAMKEIDTVSTLPADFKGQSTCAEIAIDSRGRFVYASNRGHNSIAVFAVDGKSGKLTLIQNESSGGAIPRSFALDPTGDWLIAGNQNTNNIAILKVDRKTGKLTATGDKLDLGAPVTFVFVK